MKGVFAMEYRSRFAISGIFEIGKFEIAGLACIQ